MGKYKTVVSDYEGLQSTLDTHSGQGWRLMSLTPDTWRKTSPSDHNSSASPFEEFNTTAQPTHEYSASYYLLVFQRDDTLDTYSRQVSAEENLSLGSLPPPSFFEE